MEGNKYFYDHYNVRYQLVKSNAGLIFNWLFVPGGPGADSSYFLSLINNLDMPGNYWLIDFPANGSNLKNNIKADYDFDLWDECLISAVKKFQNPIYVGHSFGGMFPLLFSELEDLLSGLVILNSAPCLWLEEAAKSAHENNLPILIEPMKEFEDNPNPDTFKKALLACVPYYFPPNSLKIGSSLLENLPVNFHAAVWWLRKVHENNFTAKWIPQNIPTLILGATHDFIAPFSLFEKDKRFYRDNIRLEKIPSAGHFPWIEKMNEVKSNFDRFFIQCSSANLNEKTLA